MAQVKSFKTPSEIEGVVIELAEKINAKFGLNEEDQDVVLIGILSGAVMFMADLMRYVHIPMQTDFVRCSSYGEGRVSGRLSFQCKWQLDLSNKHVILVDDIYDTGRTMNALMDAINDAHTPASITTCTLLKRENSNTSPDMWGFEIGHNDWVFGYGLDNVGYNRNSDTLYISE